MDHFNLPVNEKWFNYSREFSYLVRTSFFVMVFDPEISL